MSKRKGSNAERELFHKLWDNGWSTLRTAGSGSTRLPAPDLLASDTSRTLAIECKSIKVNKHYFYEREIAELEDFSIRFGAESWVGVRFDNVGWFFLPTDKLEKSKGNSFVFSLEHAKKNGLSFDELIGKYKQEKLK